MNVERVVVGDLEENCYLIENNNHLLIVDPGDEFEKIKSKIGTRIVDGVLLTHHHFDHNGALKDVLNHYGVELYDFYNCRQQEYKIGEFVFEVLYNPGHSKDSVSFYFKEKNIMFVGDFVFKSNIGRCDLDGGSFQSMKNSIAELKNKFSEDTILYPGHGDNTTLEYEKKNNVYFIQN